MDLMSSSFLPGDPRMVDQIVCELKSQGIFDQFRKECISDVDTKPAYQNLRQRVEGSVMNFLKKRKFASDSNKNQLREQLRKHITESGFLESGVERIVDQVVNPKISSVFLPKVEEVVYRFLGIQKPSEQAPLEEKPETKNFLPTDLEAVSPESVHEASLRASTEFKNEQNESIKNENDSTSITNMSDPKTEDESPPFEPLEENTKLSMHEENSVDSHCSGLSGRISIMETSNQSMDTSQTQNSQINGNSSLVTKGEEEVKMDICENTTASENSDKLEIVDESKEGKTVEVKVEGKSKNDSKRSHDKHKSSRSDKHSRDKRERSKSESKSKDSKEKSSSKQHISSNKEKDKKEETSEKEFSLEKYKIPKKEDKDVDKNKDQKSDKDSKKKSEKSSDKEKSSSSKDHSEKDKSSRDRTKSDKDKHEKDRSSSHKSKDRSSSSTKKDDREKKHREDEHKGKEREDKSSKDKSSSSSKDKEKSSSSSRHKESSSKDKESSKSSKDKSKSSSSSSSKDKDKSSDSKKDDSKSSKRDKHKNKQSSHDSGSSSTKKDKEKTVSDDHYSFKNKKRERRSTDRDSNDGSGKMNRNEGFIDNSSENSYKSSKKGSSETFSSGGDSCSNSDSVEKRKEAEVVDGVADAQKTQPIKYVKPKFASNMQEAMKIMKIRKQLAKLERHNQLVLSQIPVTAVDKKQPDELGSTKTVVNEPPQSLAQPIATLGKPEEIPLLKSQDLSMETFEALEARLAQEMSNIGEHVYGDEDDNYEYAAVTLSPIKKRKVDGEETPDQKMEDVESEQLKVSEEVIKQPKVATEEVVVDAVAEEKYEVKFNGSVSELSALEEMVVGEDTVIELTETASTEPPPPAIEQAECGMMEEKIEINEEIHEQEECGMTEEKVETNEEIPEQEECGMMEEKMETNEEIPEQEEGGVTEVKVETCKDISEGFYGFTMAEKLESHSIKCIEEGIARITEDLDKKVYLLSLPLQNALALPLKAKNGEKLVIKIDKMDLQQEGKKSSDFVPNIDTVLNGAEDPKFRQNGPLAAWENDQLPCYYFDKRSLSESENRSAILSKVIVQLEKYVQREVLHIQNNVPRSRKHVFKRKLQGSENNNSLSCNYKPPTKRAHLSDSNSIQTMCNTNVSSHPDFSLPLSPAESEKSGELKKDEPVTVRPKRGSASKRYSSADLYKPRPVLSCSSSRRRSARAGSEKS